MAWDHYNRLEAREEKSGNDENQALEAHTRKGNIKKEDNPHRNFQKTQKIQKDYSSYKCYILQKMGHIVRNCPHTKDHIRKGKYKTHHSHATEDDEPIQKKEKEDDSSEEYVLISSLTGIVTHGSDTWIIDSGASNKMSGYKVLFQNWFKRIHLIR
jgi:hypothetical protein